MSRAAANAGHPMSGVGTTDTEGTGRLRSERPVAGCRETLRRCCRCRPGWRRAYCRSDPIGLPIGLNWNVTCSPGLLSRMYASLIHTFRSSLGSARAASGTPSVIERHGAAERSSAANHVVVRVAVLSLVDDSDPCRGLSLAGDVPVQQCVRHRSSSSLRGRSAAEPERRRRGSRTAARHRPSGVTNRPRQCSHVGGQLFWVGP